MYFFYTNFNVAVSTLAGSSSGHVDGVGETFPVGVVFNPDDNCLYVCDERNNMIRKVTLLGMCFVLLFCFPPSPSPSSSNGIIQVKRVRFAMYQNLLELLMINIKNYFTYPV